MDMNNRNIQILGNVLFRLRRDQSFFFLDTMQQRQKSGALLLVLGCDFIQLL